MPIHSPGPGPFPCPYTCPFPWPERPYILRMWPRGGDPREGTRKLHKCGSWRCPSCQRYRAAVDFARIMEALQPYDVRDLVFQVLTLDQRGTYTGEAWSGYLEAVRELTRSQRSIGKSVHSCVAQ